MTETPIYRYNFKYDHSVAEFAVSKGAYLKAHPGAAFKLVATAALVLDTSHPEPRILLLQRAANDSHPGKWEPPGGAVDDEDLTILHAAARELWEEAGLQACRIGGPVGDPHFFPRSNGDQICRFNFAVHVLSNDGAALRTQLDPNEHQSYVWATEEEVRASRTGAVDLEFVKEEVKRTVLLAFAHPQGD
jgi:8-oxo-dGTP pyrophosphatase MutT (NUDIX family)